MKPTHFLCVVNEIETTNPDTGETATKSRFTEIAALWPTKSGGSYYGNIPEGVSIGGCRVVITEAKNGGGQ